MEHDIFQFPKEKKAETSEAYILKEVSTKDEEVLYQMVEDDVEFSAIAKVFSELTDDDTALEYQDCSCT